LSFTSLRHGQTTNSREQQMKSRRRFVSKIGIHRSPHVVFFSPPKNSFFISASLDLASCE